MSQETRLSELRNRHITLEKEIEQEYKRPKPNVTKIGKLKRQKLELKDEIARVQELVGG